MSNSEIRLAIPAGKVRSYSFDSDTTEKTLDMLGVGYTQKAVQDMKDYFKAYGFDAALPNVAMMTTPSVSTPIQLLQHWLTEVIEVVTAARDIDNIVGRTTAGNWADAEIVQTILERTGQARPYGDNTNIPLSSWNTNFERRTIVRFEEGVEVGILEEERAGRMRLSSANEKRAAAAESLAIEMNNIGFYGYNDGSNRTYGFLNDPNLPAYETAAQGASGQTTWASKTFDEILADFRTIAQKLRTQTGNLFNPNRDAWVVAMGTDVVQYLDIPNALGSMSIREWLNKTYPNLRIESAIQLNGANGGANVMYAFAERINGKKVVDQYVQDVFRMLGIEKKAKGFLEDYSNATAGIFFKQPIGVVRITGI